MERSQFPGIHPPSSLISFSRQTSGAADAKLPNSTSAALPAQEASLHLEPGGRRKGVSASRTLSPRAPSVPPPGDPDQHLSGSERKIIYDFQDVKHKTRFPRRGRNLAPQRHCKRMKYLCLHAGLPVQKAESRCKRTAGLLPFAPEPTETPPWAPSGPSGPPGPSLRCLGAPLP